MSAFQSECPICGAAVQLQASPLVGELIDCGDCGGQLEVRAAQPLQLTEAPQVAEDWGQ